MQNYTLSLFNNSTYAMILYSICTIAFLLVPFIIYYFKYRQDTSLINKYLQVFPNPEEAYAAYVRDQENLNIVEPYRTKSLFTIIYYFFVMYILSEFVSSIAISIYLYANQFSSDIINPNSDYFNQNVYEHMQSSLNIILQIVIYGIAIIGVVILMWKPFEEDLKRINKKTFAFGAMGFGLLYAANIVGTIFLTLIGVMNFKSNASNQDAINSMFNTSIPNLIILFIVIVIMAPILEELVFRKAIFKQFKNKYLALIVSSLAFGMLHVISSALLVFINITNGEAAFFDFVLELIYVIPYSLMGFALGIAYIKSNKNIVSSMFAHFLNNLISYIGSLIISLHPELLESIEDAAVILINFLH